MFKNGIQSSARQKNILWFGLFILFTGFMLLSFSNGTMSQPPKMVHMKGQLFTTFVIDGDLNIQHVDIAGFGTISHIGRVNYDGHVTLDIQQGIAYDGLATFTAPNGDEFHTTYSGPSIEEGDIASGQLTHLIVNGSGTGKFEGISGSFVATILNNRLTHSGHQSLDGEISLK